MGEPGELYDDAYEVKSTKKEKVGPWSGWDEKIKNIAIETEKIDLQEMNDLDRMIPKVGRPKIRKTGRKGRPTLNRLGKRTSRGRKKDKRTCAYPRIELSISAAQK